MVVAERAARPSSLYERDIRSRRPGQSRYRVQPNRRRKNSSTLTVLKLLRQRASIREFTYTPVPDHILETVLLAALRAPASFNFQPYTFVEIRDPQNCAELADIAQHQGLDT